MEHTSWLTAECMLVSSSMLKALINKVLLILYRHIKNIFAANGLHTTNMFIINPACATVMLLLFCFHFVLHALETFCLHCFFTSSPSLCSPRRLYDSLPPAVPILPICTFTHPLLLFFLALGWWQSGILSLVLSVPWYALLCHCCCLVSLFSSSSSSTPGSPPTLTYVSASDVLISHCTMLITVLNSPTLLLLPPATHLNCPILCPNMHLSRHPTFCAPTWQDFLGQVHCTLGEIVGSPASRLEKPLG